MDNSPKYCHPLACHWASGSIFTPISDIFLQFLVQSLETWLCVSSCLGTRNVSINTVSTICPRLFTARQHLAFPANRSKSQILGSEKKKKKQNKMQPEPQSVANAWGLIPPRANPSPGAPAPGAIHFADLSPVQTPWRRRNDQLGEEGQSTSSDSQQNCAKPTYTGVRLAHDCVGCVAGPGTNQLLTRRSPSRPRPSSFPLFARKKQEEKRKSLQ